MVAGFENKVMVTVCVRPRRVTGSGGGGGWGGSGGVGGSSR